MTATDSTAAIEAVFRIEFPRVVAVLARTVGDLDLAEELAQEALVDALRQWPVQGTPRNPGAWLTTVGRRKAVDLVRRDRVGRRKYAELAVELPVSAPATETTFAPDDDASIADDRLRLMFVACHPVVPVTGRVALTLRLVGGLSVPEIARAYVLADATVAQRIVRAKRAIAQAGVPFEVPIGSDRSSRLGAVLEVIYLIFNEGYSATSGQGWIRPDLCGEAVRLGRVLAGLMPDESEVHGLVALMEFQSSRLRSRVSPTGDAVLLVDQDRHTWDQLLIRRGDAALALADSNAAARGPYALQAAIAACHAHAIRLENTDWTRLAGLYTELARVTPSPIVELNRAVVISKVHGPEAALALVDALVATGTLERYHLLCSVRGDLLEQLDRWPEAAVEFDRAADLAGNEPERVLCRNRAQQCRDRVEGVTAAGPS